jgi:hypothetical protein
MNGNQEQEDMEAEDTNKVSKKVIPLHVKLQALCLEKCQHFISNPDKQIRIRIIEVIRELSRNLATEHENEFLPLVHKLWPPLMQRFGLDDLIVKIRIIYLLFDLSVLCGDFINSRFVKEFIKPKLCHLMYEQSRLSMSHDSTYIYTNVFKLQVSILTNIDKMCILFDIKELDLEFIVERMILNHLDRRQPKRLQLLAVDALKNISFIDADIVWMCLHYTLPFEQYSKFSNADQTDLEEIRPDYSMFIKNKKLNIQFSDDILQSLFSLLKSL